MATRSSKKVKNAIAVTTMTNARKSVAIRVWSAKQIKTSIRQPKGVNVVPVNQYYLLPPSLPLLYNNRDFFF